MGGGDAGGAAVIHLSEASRGPPAHGRQTSHPQLPALPGCAALRATRWVPTAPRVPKSAGPFRSVPSEATRSSTAPVRAAGQARPKRRRRPGPAAAVGEGRGEATHGPAQGRAGRGQAQATTFRATGPCGSTSSSHASPPSRQALSLTRSPLDCRSEAIWRRRGCAPCTFASSSTLHGGWEGEGSSEE